MKNQFEDSTRRVIRSSIDWSGVGLRLDDYLAARFTYRSADEWRERIARREILVNDLPAEPERILALHEGSNIFRETFRSRKPSCRTGSLTRTTNF
ncbi:MAG: hypothetical protein V8T86_05835 [Victivallis sp.]